MIFYGLLASQKSRQQAACGLQKMAVLNYLYSLPITYNNNITYPVLQLSRNIMEKCVIHSRNFERTYLPTSLVSNVVLNVSQLLNYFSECWSFSRILTPAFFNQPAQYGVKKIRLSEYNLQNTSRYNSNGNGNYYSAVPQWSFLGITHTDWVHIWTTKMI